MVLDLKGELALIPLLRKFRTFSESRVFLNVVSGAGLGVGSGAENQRKPKLARVGATKPVYSLE
jgi:hypothetical protein